MIGLVATLAACQGTPSARECLPRVEYDQILAERAMLEGESEYTVLSRFGKPTNISMNTRSEKEYLYHPCDDKAETVAVKFGSTARVKEVYVKDIPGNQGK